MSQFFSIPKFILHSFIFLIFITKCISEKVPAKEYYSLPPLYDLENFDICISEGTDDVQYCVFEIELMPLAADVNSSIWNIIQKVNEDPRNFRHNIIMKGRCLPKDLTLDEDIIDKYTIEFNHEYESNQLKTRIRSFTCNRFETTFDTLDIFAVFVLIFIFTIVIFGTIVDVRNWSEKSSLWCTALKCLSLRRSIKDLTTTKNDKYDLKHLDGIRAINVQIVLFGHTVLALFYSPVANPEFLESTYEVATSGVGFNGSAILQTFFMFSGLMLSLSFYKYIYTFGKFDVRYVLGAIANRYFRLVPAYAILILMNATLLYYTGAGPLWQRLIYHQRYNCRTFAWRNLLFINNEYDVEEQCFEPSWYLAADTQMYVISLVLLSLIWIWKRGIAVILGTALVILTLIPGIITYVYDLDPMHLCYPELLRTLFADYWTFTMVYVKSYTNGSSYIMGLILGYFIYFDRFNKANVPKNRWFQVIWAATIFLMIFGYLFGSGYYFYHEAPFIYSATFAAVFASLYKPFFALGTLILLWGIQNRIGCIADFFRMILESRPLCVIGRLAYCSYLVHFSLFHANIAAEVVPVYYDYYRIYQKTLSNSITSYALGFLLCIFVEYPFVALWKWFFFGLILNATPSSESKEKTAVTEKMLKNDVSNNNDDENEKMSLNNNDEK